jgi:uncharacterized membrane protein YcaP (DUF421 family)
MEAWQIHLGDWVRVLFGNMPPEFLVEVLIRVVFIYLLVIFCIRMMGKRMASQLSRNELVAISSLAASIGIPIQTPDRGLLPALLVALIVVAAQRIVALRLFKDQRFERRSQGNISILVDNCCLNIRAMKRARITRQEIFARLRAYRIKHLGQVKRLYFEASGDFTLVREPQPKPGLSVLPLEDTEFRAAQQYDPELYVCNNCGAGTQQSGRPCARCGNTAYEYPMVNR